MQPSTIRSALCAAASRSRRFTIALAVAGVAGCYTWRTAPAAAPAAGDGTLLVTVDSGRRRLELERATVTADSVVGFIFRVETLRAGSGWEPIRPQPPRGERTAFPRAEVISIQTRQLHGGRTAGLAIGLTVIGLLAALIYAVSQIDFQ